MLATVYLDDQVRLRGVEVDDGVAQRFLTVELDTQHLFAAQTRPQTPLGIRHV